MKIKTSELQGAAFDWAVAKCEGVNEKAFRLYYEPTEPTDYDSHGYPEFHYSTNWSQGKPIIEREKIRISYVVGLWQAKFDNALRVEDEHTQYGPTPLIAAMRCYVASKMGDEVDVPEELK